MREIKFRGKSVESREWIYGDLVHNALTSRSMTVSVAIKPDNCYPIEVIPESVGQYTESHSKGWKEIYGGDIVEGDSWKEPYALKTKKIAIGWVNFSPDCGWYFCTNNLDGSYRSLPKGCRTLPNLKDCEVVGNIHDNPELIHS
jgi:uncharacterized phage protein (TIGR01671 family)